MHVHRIRPADCVQMSMVTAVVHILLHCSGHKGVLYMHTTAGAQKAPDSADAAGVATTCSTPLDGQRSAPAQAAAPTKVGPTALNQHCTRVVGECDKH